MFYTAFVTMAEQGFDTLPGQASTSYFLLGAAAFFFGTLPLIGLESSSGVTAWFGMGCIIAVVAVVYLYLAQMDSVAQEIRGVVWLGYPSMFTASFVFPRSRIGRLKRYTLLCIAAALFVLSLRLNSLFTQEIALKGYSLSTTELIVGFVVTASILLISFACDVLFVSGTRRLLRLCITLTFPRLLAVVLMNLAVGAALVSPLLLPGDSSLRFISTVNLIDVLAASVFVILVIAMLAHRVSWPLVSRTVYAMQGMGIAKRKAALAMIGTGLLAYGCGMPRIIQKFLELV
jgi:hypothetical protein